VGASVQRRATFDELPLDFLVNTISCTVNKGLRSDNELAESSSVHALIFLMYIIAKLFCRGIQAIDQASNGSAVLPF
jgi:hypothetical protein